MTNDKRIDVRVNETLHAAIEEKARNEGLSVSAYIRSVLIRTLGIYKSNKITVDSR